MSQQGTLLPVRVRSIVASPFNSADMTEIAIGDDSHDYAIKNPLPNYPEHAATEAICYKIASTCGLAVPLSVKLVFADGREAFGSRFEGGVTQYTKLTLSERLDVL